MSKKKYWKISLSIVVTVLILLFLTKFVVELWIGRKIEVTVNEKYNDYHIAIGKVHIELLKSGVTLENLTVSSKLEQGGIKDLSGEITSIKLRGINLVKVLFKKEIDISEVTIFNSCLRGKMPFVAKSGPSMVSGLNLKIDHLFFNMIDLTFGNSLSSKTYLVKDGLFNIYDLHFSKQDTITTSIFNQFDFEAEKLLFVSSDSLYSFKAYHFNYSETTKTMAADSFLIHPNYNDYEFTSRSKFETDRIDASFRNIIVHDFSASGYLKSRNLIGSYIEIGEMDLNAFRDKRKKFLHVNKLPFQNMISNYHASINIDSISLLDGNVTYIEHAEQANEPGRISFNKVNAKIYKISNYPGYRTEKAYLKLFVNAMLMGKGKMNVQLKGRIFDQQNTFSLNGTLSGINAGDLNPILEKNAYIFATSGRIDEMNFSFTANNTKAIGTMTLLYHGLKIAIKNKKSDDTTAIKERLGSFIANIKILNSNPLPGKEVRTGIIENRRDPEKFLFNYCFKSILSGIKSSLTTKKKK